MPELEWTASAVEDLTAIVDFISEDNTDAALALMRQFYPMSDLLCWALPHAQS